MSGSVRMARETGWSSVAWYLLECAECLSSFQRRAWDRGLIARAFVQASVVDVSPEFFGLLAVL
jgi:hypothetical protein